MGHELVRDLATYPPVPASVRTARLHAVERLEAIGVAAEVIERVAMVVSELCANAVAARSAAGPDESFRVELVVDDDPLRVRCAVSSPGRVDDLPPRERWGPSDVLAVSGRGLALVDAVADRVEIWEDDGMVTVEAELGPA
jgi:anti-sigma regulatory factor (Ser/Thr protein kinase)